MINEKLRDEILARYSGDTKFAVTTAINEYARSSAEQNAAALTFKDGAEWAEQVCRAVGRRLSQGAGYACNIAADEIKDQLSVINAAPPIPTAMGWPAPSQEGVGQGEKDGAAPITSTGNPPFVDILRRSKESVNAAAQASESCGLKPENRDLNRRDSEPAVAAPLDTPTPETDAMIYQPDGCSDCVGADFARKLERERNEARHNCAVAVGKADQLQKRLDDAGSCESVVSEFRLREKQKGLEAANNFLKDHLLAWADKYHTVNQLYAALKAENEVLRKDAERYRWIKGHKNEIPRTYSFGGRPYWIVDNNEYDDFDAAIDAAKGSQP